MPLTKAQKRLTKAQKRLTKAQKRQRRKRRRAHFKSQIEARKTEKNQKSALTIQKCFRKYWQRAKPTKIIQKWFKNFEYIKQYHICTDEIENLRHIYSDIHNKDMDFDSTYVYLKNVPAIAIAVLYDFPKVIPMLYNQYRKCEFPKEYLQQLLNMAITHNRVKCARVILDLGAKAMIPKYRVEAFNYRHAKCKLYEMKRQCYSDDDDWYSYDNEPSYFKSASSDTCYLSGFEIFPPLFMSESAEMTKLLIRYGADPLEYLIEYDGDSTLPEASDKTLMKLVYNLYKYGYSNKRIPKDKMKSLMAKTKEEIKGIKGAFVETNITAIHYAIKNFKPDIVMVLLERMRELQELDRIFGKDINRIISGYMGIRSVADFKHKFNYPALLPALTLDISRNSTKVFVNPETGMCCKWHKQWNSSSRTLQISQNNSIKTYNHSKQCFTRKEYYQLPYDEMKYLNYDRENDVYYKHVRYVMPEFKNSSCGCLAEWSGGHSTVIFSYVPSSHGRISLGDDIEYNITSEAITVSHAGTWEDFKNRWWRRGVCIESIKNIFGTYRLVRENNLASIQKAMEDFFVAT
jgi:hypothetical protein